MTAESSRSDFRWFCSHLISDLPRFDISCDRSSHQYLKELSSEKTLELIHKQAEALVGLYINTLWQKLSVSNSFQSWSIAFKIILMMLTKKVPDKRPQIIIVALDPFKLLYEYEAGSVDSVNTLPIERGQAVLFTCSLWHARGSNSKDVCLYFFGNDRFSIGSN